MQNVKLTDDFHWQSVENDNPVHLVCFRPFTILELKTLLKFEIV